MPLTKFVFYGLEHSLRNNGFMPTWPYQTIKILEIQFRFLEPSGYCTGITFTFCRTNVFDCFCSVMDLFKLAKSKFLNWTMLHEFHWAPHSFGLVPHRSKELCKLLDYAACLSVWFLNDTWSEAMHTMCQYTNNNDTTNHWLSTMTWSALVMWYTPWNYTIKMLQNFWVTLLERGHF